MPLQTHFNVKSIASNSEEVSSAVYLQASIISQALIFVTRSQGWSFLERPGTLLMITFVVVQLVKFMQNISNSKICGFSIVYNIY
jgi:H+-transporting ATPase